MFGKKKPTEFDQAQDKQLKQLMANQTVLLDNNKYWIKNDKTQWSWLKWLEKYVKKLEANNQALLKGINNLEARMAANEKKDAEQAELFATLSRSATQTEVTTEG